MMKKKMYQSVFLGISVIIVLALVLFNILAPHNLMHSDITAEVILSKLLSEENKLITRNWFYSTEIRIIYTQLFMMPLFKIFSSYELVRLLSVFICYILVILTFLYVFPKYNRNKKWMFLSLALFLTPLSNEYLDMVFIGCFYMTQIMCTYLVLGWFIKEKEENILFTRRSIIKMVLFALVGVVLGLSGLRYLASLYLPLIAAVALILFTEKESAKQTSVWHYAMLALIGTLGAGIGFLVNKFYLAVHYSFDKTAEVAFVEISEIPERFLSSFRLMLEFLGYYPVGVVTGRGIVNALKAVFFVFLICVIVYLFKHRYDLLELKQRMLLYYFLACFLLNWYMLVFTDVLMQYRYWIPVYVIAILLVGIFFDVYQPATAWQVPIFAAFVGVIALSSLYGELWQDVKYNDCEKRYAYMEFLEENEYEFGYATFWNSSVTEYLSNGTIKVGHLGGSDGVVAPYEWLSPKAYYQEGFHSGKTFLLLARTEEAGMLNGDFTVMPDGEKVYEDEYYAIYEGEGMYLFLDE